MSHVSSVRVLYKRILSLHRKLPLEFKAIGDEYVKAEFKSHKAAKPEEAVTFMEEWRGYALMVEAQISKGDALKVGSNLATDKLEDFREEQIGQLLELHKETAKPSQFVTDTER